MRLRKLLAGLYSTKQSLFTLQPPIISRLFTQQRILCVSYFPRSARSISLSTGCMGIILGRSAHHLSLLVFGLYHTLHFFVELKQLRSADTSIQFKMIHHTRLYLDLGKSISSIQSSFSFTAIKVNLIRCTLQISHTNLYTLVFGLTCCPLFGMNLCLKRISDSRINTIRALI